MNAGAYESEMKDIVESVLFYDAGSQEMTTYHSKTAVLNTAVVFSRKRPG